METSQLLPPFDLDLDNNTTKYRPRLPVFFAIDDFFESAPFVDPWSWYLRKPIGWLSEYDIEYSSGDSLQPTLLTREDVLWRAVAIWAHDRIASDPFLRTIGPLFGFRSDFECVLLALAFTK